MSRTAAGFTQADVARAVRVARKEGAACVDVLTAGTIIRIRLDDVPKDEPTATVINPWDEHDYSEKVADL